MKTVLSIAGSDCSGGAGIQADIKTIAMNGVYAMTAITALTVQNTTGVSEIMNVTPEFLGKQIDAIFEDIPPDAVKVGMVSSPEFIDVIAERLTYYNAKNIVVDPVMVSTSGSILSDNSTIKRMKEKLFPLATIITPNIPEAIVLSKRKIESIDDMEKATRDMAEAFGCAVLCKGGHNINDANDVLCVNGKYTWFYGEKIDNPNTHGTGCTLSSAIASNLAKGFDIIQSIENSKAYISGAISSMMNLGHGSGPIDHTFNLYNK